MDLTRRDAVLALVSAGLLAGTQIDALTNSDADLSPPQEHAETLLAAAEVLYPSDVEPSMEFIETYVIGRQQSDQAYICGLTTSIDRLEQVSTRRTGQPFRALPVSRRGEILRATGADRAFPDPEGNTAQQLRYYLINDLLYALYSTPKGGELVGNPNPMGYPGGTEAYQRGPTDE